MTCSRCATDHATDAKCPLWALERQLLTSMIPHFEREMSDDISLVLSVAGGIHISLWSHVVAILAINPAAAKQMADKLRALAQQEAK